MPLGSIAKHLSRSKIMHIVEQHYLGLELKNPSRIHVLRAASAFAADGFLELIGDCDSDTQAKIILGVKSSLLNPYIENYLFTQTAQEVLDNIKVSDSFDLEILETLPRDETHFYNFLYGKDRVIYCRWSDNMFFITDLDRSTNKEDIKRSVVLILSKSSPKVFSATLIDAIKCLIFLKLSEPEIVHLAAGQKRGTRKQGHYNASSLPVTIVDSTWNQKIVREEGFGVSGHFRIQRHGKGNMDLKLIWIKPFEKHGYVRLPKAEAL